MMKRIITCLCISVLLTRVIAQEINQKVNRNKKMEQGPISNPVTQKITRCPATFQKVGKECIKVENQAAVPQCGASSQLTSGNVCETYLGKATVCPSGFSPQGSRCERQQTGTPVQSCSPGYTLTNDNQCSRPIDTPPVQQCPAGSVLKGDICLSVHQREPTFGCSPGFTLNGRICQTEELYNCTPPRTDAPSTPSVDAATSSSPSISLSSTASNMIQITASAPSSTTSSFLSSSSIAYSPNTAPSSPFNIGQRLNQEPIGSYGGVLSSSTPPGATLYSSPEATGFLSSSAGSPQGGQNFITRFTGSIPNRRSLHGVSINEEYDYVVNSTCKRVRRVSALLVCESGVLIGKLCRVEVEVPKIVAPNQQSIGTDVQSPQISCPDARFTLLSPTLCLLVEFANFSYVCPEGTTDAGDRCVVYSAPTMTCPPEFTLETDSLCVRTIRESPIVEYTVRYTCVGKNCDRTDILPGTSSSGSIVV